MSEQRTKVIEWINEAALTTDNNLKVQLLFNIQELVLNSSSGKLLDEFYSDIACYQVNRHKEVRKFCVGFLEKASSQNRKLMPSAVAGLMVFLQDRCPDIQNKAIQSCLTVYKRFLQCSSPYNTIGDEVVWIYFNEIKQRVSLLLKSDNEKIQNGAMVFIKNIIILPNYSNRCGLEDENVRYLGMITDISTLQSVKKGNLINYINCLTAIAKHLPTYLEKVAIVFEAICEQLKNSNDSVRSPVLNVIRSKIYDFLNIRLWNNRMGRLYDNFKSLENSFVPPCGKNQLDEKSSAAEQALLRILSFSSVNSKEVTSITSILAANFYPNFAMLVLHFITSDLQKRLELAIMWLYKEYDLLKNFKQLPFNKQYDLQRYEFLLNFVISQIVSENWEAPLMRLLLEVPLIPDSTIDQLNKYCDEERYLNLLAILSEIILRRPPLRFKLLKIFQELLKNKSPKIRREAVRQLVVVYEKNILRPEIEKHALESLSSIVEHPEVKNLYLFMEILSTNGKLIHHLGEIFVKIDKKMKLEIFRQIVDPVKKLGMHSEDLLNYISACPEGTDTLITRMVHILTEQGNPSEKLVSRIRDLYKTRINDIRFLIPVLIAFSKEEILALMPKYLKMGFPLFKRVFKSLIKNPASPLKPYEFLVALHTLNFDLNVIVQATSLVRDKDFFSQEDLMESLKILIEIEPLPNCIMRTAMLSLVTYPQMIGFIINFLKQLVDKQVWNYEKVWKGFLTCCERTKPFCYNVLIKMPKEQLYQVFYNCPELERSFCSFIKNLKK